MSLGPAVAGTPGSPKASIKGTEWLASSTWYASPISEANPYRHFSYIYRAPVEAEKQSTDSTKEEARRHATTEAVRGGLPRSRKPAQVVQYHLPRESRKR